MVEVMKIIAISFKMTHAHSAPSVPLTLLQTTADPHLCRRLLDPHRHVWVSLLYGHYSFLLGLGAHKVFFVHSKSLLPQSCVSSVVKSLQSQILWGFSVALPDPQVGKYVVGPRIFLTV